MIKQTVIVFVVAASALTSLLVTGLAVAAPAPKCFVQTLEQGGSPSAKTVKVCTPAPVSKK